MEKYQYILFDLDGTLTDSAEGIVNSVLHALEKKGIQEPDREKLLGFVGPPLADSFMKFYGMTREEAAEMTPLYREYFSVRGWQENSVYDGIPAVLAALQKQGKHLIVATSKPELFARRIIEHFSLDSYFELVCGSSLDGRITTKGQVINHVISQLGREHLDQMIMVGDREHDVIGARENGLCCIGVLYGYGSREELERAGAAAICPTVKELPEVLRIAAVSGPASHH